MNNNGTFESVNGKQEYSIWDITLINNELTLFSNGYYLGYNEESNEIISDKYMKRLKYINTTNGDYIISVKNNILLSIRDNKIILTNNNDDKENYSVFQFIDIN